MNREYHRWYSHRLGRDMELLVYGHAGAKVLVFPTRDGRFHEYEDIGMVRSISHKIDAGHLQLYCVDSLDHESLYCFWNNPADRIRRYLQFQEYILHEVMPLMFTKNWHPCTIAHGCSLGAYHALNFAFRYPHLFSKVSAFSGRYDLTIQVESFKNLFDGYYDDNVFYNTPTHYLAGLNCPEILGQLRKLDIILTIGDQDPFFDNNHYLSRMLHDKGVRHELNVWHGRAHNGHHWRNMARLYL